MSSSAPLRAVRLGSTETVVEHRSDGSILLRRKEALGPYPRRITDPLVHWAKAVPDRVFLADRAGGDGEWNRLTWGETLGKLRAVAQALLDRGLGPARPLVVLSENSIELQLMTLAASYAGVTCVAVSPSYSLLATDFVKLRHICGLVEPGLVFAADAGRYAAAIDAVIDPRTPVVSLDGKPAGSRTTESFERLLATRASADVDAAHEQVGPETIGKILFTSGSTGMPKGAPLTQRMICANQQAVSQAFAFLGDEPPVFVDWLPWHHTFGGNNDIGMAIFNGGSFWIDQGRPLPGLFERTVRNLREISPTFYMGVPKVLELLIPYLEKDRELRESLFRRVRATMFGGAAIPAHVLRALERLAIGTIGERITNVGVIGSTEAGPCALLANWHIGAEPEIGVPAPGLEAKIVPAGNKMELRFRGPQLIDGYWRSPELTKAAFDEEGFYRIGDAVLPVDARNWGRGLLFNGRVAEDFKLTTGTWVNVGAMRDRLIALLAPLARDVVITGHGRDFACAIVFPNFDALRELAGAGGANASPEALAASSVVRGRIEALLRSQDPKLGAAERIERIVLEIDPPTLDNGELTDKNSVGQRAVLERRTAVVDELHAAVASARTLERRRPG